MPVEQISNILLALWAPLSRQKLAIGLRYTGLLCRITLENSEFSAKLKNRALPR